MFFTNIKMNFEIQNVVKKKFERRFPSSFLKQKGNAIAFYKLENCINELSILMKHKTFCFLK